MDLKLDSQMVNGVNVFVLDGRVVFGEEAARLRDAVKGALADHKKIVLDMQKVSYVDSGGLGTLVSLFSSAKAAGADLKLARLGTRVIGLLQVTKLFTVFDVHESVESALASFR